MEGERERERISKVGINVGAGGGHPHTRLWIEEVTCHSGSGKSQDLDVLQGGSKKRTGTYAIL